MLRTSSCLLACLLSTAAIAQGEAAATALPQRAPAGCTPASAPGGGQARLFAGASWPGGVVPFTYAANVTPAMQAALQAAMAEITTRVRVQFVPRGAQADHVVVRDSTINSSPIGRVGGPQFLDIANWNQRFEVVHALMHVLGFWHEHQRPDRDQFVAVQAAGVDPQFAAFFAVVPVGNTFGLGYDFDSVTHFGATEGGLGGATTLLVLPPNQGQQAAIGQRTHLSTGDLEALRRAYGSLLPPAITSITPGTVPSYLPPALTIVGVRLDEVTRVLLDNAAMTFVLQSPTQLRANLPLGPNIGSRLVTLESGAGPSAAVPLVVTGNDPPVLFGPSAVSRNIALPFRIYTDATRLNVLLAAPDNVPSSLPGVIALGIGSQFTTILDVLSGTGPANGDFGFTLRAPATLQPGLRFWLQSVAFDPANPVLPVSVSNVLPVTIL